MTKQVKKCLYLIATVVAFVAIIVSIVPQFAFAASTQDEYAHYFSGGDGSYENPYLITDKNELEHIKETFKIDEDEGIYCTYKSFKLVNNIYLTETWTPIGGEFLGVLDGNNKSIYNIELAFSNSWTDCGFFKYNRGEIKNLNFVNVNIKSGEPTASANWGTIAGTNNGTITNCKVYGNLKVDSYNANVGGIAGRSVYGMINYCENYASITGSGTIGGIVGYSYGSAIIDCINSGAITYNFEKQNGCAAGIAGKAEKDTYFKMCTNYGNIVYGGPTNSLSSAIFPCMAQIVGWSVSATLENCAIVQGKTNYDKLYKGLIINQKVYCSDGAVGRE